jgi:predicted RNA binding protein YcfA (HicA-like mRNA interferase family)
MCLLAAANILYTIGRKVVRIKGSHFVRRKGMEKENLVSHRPTDHPITIRCKTISTTLFISLCISNFTL